MAGPKLHLAGPMLHLSGPTLHLAGPMLHLAGPMLHPATPNLIRAKIPVLGLDIVGARLSLGWSEMGPFLSRVMLWEPSKFYIVWAIT